MFKPTDEPQLFKLLCLTAIVVLTASYALGYVFIDLLNLVTLTDLQSKEHALHIPRMYTGLGCLALCVMTYKLYEDVKKA